LFGRTDLPDVEWIAKAGELEMVVAHKDYRIRYRPAERQAVVAAALRMICLTSGNLKADEMVARFRDNLEAIEQWWPKPGPWILAVRRGGVEELTLDDPPRAPGP
jgi:hypothetical protein